ncbi:hypothetical protein Hanom_Chr06g00501221 [Helianthus anomalus]
MNTNSQDIKQVKRNTGPATKLLPATKIIKRYLVIFFGCNLLKAINVTAADKEYLHKVTLKHNPTIRHSHNLKRMLIVSNNVI